MFLFAQWSEMLRMFRTLYAKTHIAQCRTSVKGFCLLCYFALLSALHLISRDETEKKRPLFISLEKEKRRRNKAKKERSKKKKCRENC